MIDRLEAASRQEFGRASRLPSYSGSTDGSRATRQGLATMTNDEGHFSTSCIVKAGQSSLSAPGLDRIFAL